MAFKNIEYVLFDAANTLIHKPSLWYSLQSVLEKNGYKVSTNKLQLHHKLLSEFINFPDRTSEDFYNSFNTEILMSFGILPSQEILKDLFKACSYLPWEKFSDTVFLDLFDLPIGVLSNFNNTLPDILSKLFGNLFSNIIVSETLQIRKPDTKFYEYAAEKIGVPPDKILYIGDSLKLDIIPAKSVGFQTLLIDRLNIFSSAEHSLDNLANLKTYLLKE